MVALASAIRICEMNAGAGDGVCTLTAHFDSPFNRDDVVSIITP
jgi:hypothetical protein